MNTPLPENIVAIGGGTGLPLVLRCLLTLGVNPSAVVTMADDGGSSGVLRRELGMVPPGDVRNCLVALADPEERFLAEVFRYRFSEGEGLAGHALGNLILAALNDLTQGFEYAVKLAERHLKCRGRVLPSTFDDVKLCAYDRSGTLIDGQATVSVNPVAIKEVHLVPSFANANPEAVEAIRCADVIIVGPGSLYTSIIPNLLVPEICEAIRESSAQVVYLCNVANMRGETHGLSAREHVEALFEHGLRDRIDTVVVNSIALDFLDPSDDTVAQVVCLPACVTELERAGCCVLQMPLVDINNPTRHSEELLTDALWEVLGDVVYR